MKAATVNVLLFFVCSLFISPVQASSKEAPWYIGSEKCRDCHMDQFNHWQASGHPYKLRVAEKVRYTGIPLPKGFTWEDIAYVIGGKNKKARFIDQKGFIITQAKDGTPAPTQYNMIDGTWSNYNAGKVKPYKCGPCHMTAYQKEGHKDGLPGMIGDWVENGIGCEECHGPGSTHAYQQEPTKETIKKDIKGESCGKCHQRSGMDIPPLAAKGFVRHHEQFNEVNVGAHSGTDCVECHDPHKRAINIRATCISCHDEKGFVNYAETTHGKSGIPCVDCHMPRATKSAVKTGRFAGDVRTHLVKIELDSDATMFEKGKLGGKEVTFAKGFVTADFACLNCHGSRDRKWAAKNGEEIHETD